MYSQFLKKKIKSIGVWGTGYIGFSTMMYYAESNINVIGYDINSEKVDSINNGNIPLKDLKDWFNFDIKNLVKEKNIIATNNYKDLINEDVIVHFIAIPTEKDGKPYFSILEDVIKKISETKELKLDNPPLIIIESTLKPESSDNIILPLLKKKGIRVGKDILFAVAPRRDWFVEGNKSLKELDRVFGAVDQTSKNETKEVLEIVCSKLHVASSYKVSEMVKSIENAYRHMEITLANQLSIAFPSINMREVLKLVGTKWNIGTFYPGFGSGGYCIPLSSQYVISDLKDKNKLTLLRETIKTDNEINILIANSIVKRGLKKVGILGLSYKGNLKVSILSPIIPFVKELKRKSIEVFIYDPYFSKKEINDILSIDSFNYPNDLNKFDCIVLSVDHDEFKENKKIKKYLKNCKFILDNNGVWENIDFRDLRIEYHISGDSNWLDNE